MAQPEKSARLPKIRPVELVDQLDTELRGIARLDADIHGPLQTLLAELRFRGAPIAVPQVAQIPLTSIELPTNDAELFELLTAIHQEIASSRDESAARIIRSGRLSIVRFLRELARGKRLADAA